MSTNRALPASFTIPALSEMPTLTLWPTRRQQSWFYQYSYRYVMGDPMAKHTPGKPYRPPFARGRSYRVSQAFNDAYSHQTPPNQYAVDIVMPEGTPVHAARAGVVIEARYDFSASGTGEKKHASLANLVRILHDDGTMAVYAHLKPTRHRLAPGTRVFEGQVIAESGNTGFSSGPHLHFVIHKNVGMQIRSVPFQFEGSDGKGITPREGTVLTAY